MATGSASSVGFENELSQFAKKLAERYIEDSLAPSSSRRKKAIPVEQELALEMVPKTIQKPIREVALDPTMNSTVLTVMSRWQEFRSPLAAMLVGIALDPDARNYVEDAFDATWGANRMARQSTLTASGAREIVVGAGLHAAIYCGVRVAMGFEPPIVLEEKDRVGGIFAASRRASFFLNSRNRPGDIAVPGQMGALNFIPGAAVQPSDLGDSEFQTNDALAWVVRTSLAMSGAKVITNTKAMTTTYGADMNTLDVESFGEKMKVKIPRVIWASGTGEAKVPVAGGDERVKTGGRFLTFEEFISKLDSPFPLRGMKRVAVVGSGDAARTVIEALCGQGPGKSLSVASLDWPETIDWYGCPYPTQEEWVTNNRSRYKGIGSLLPCQQFPEKPFRVQPKPRAAGLGAGYDCAYVGQTPYDFVLICAGFENKVLTEYMPFSFAEERYGNRRSSKQVVGYDLHVVGPAAEIAVADTEQELLRGISENAASIFRYGPRTAALASALD